MKSSSPRRGKVMENVMIHLCSKWWVVICRVQWPTTIQFVYIVSDLRFLYGSKCIYEVNHSSFSEVFFLELGFIILLAVFEWPLLNIRLNGGVVRLGGSTRSRGDDEVWLSGGSGVGGAGAGARRHVGPTAVLIYKLHGIHKLYFGSVSNYSLRYMTHVVC